MIHLTDEQKAQAVADRLTDWRHPLVNLSIGPLDDVDARHLIVVHKNPDKGLGDKGVGLKALIDACARRRIPYAPFFSKRRLSTYYGIVIRLRDVERLNNELWPQRQK